MKISLRHIAIILVAIWISGCTVAQKPLYNASSYAHKQEIQDYSKLSDLREIKAKPAKYAKAFVAETKTIYYFDPVSKAADDSLTTIKQRFVSVGRWVALNNVNSGSGESSEAPYKVYTALLTQTGGNAPVGTVFQNTIGEITWSYEGNGYYEGTCAGCFPENKTYPTLTNSNNTDIETDFHFIFNIESVNQIAIHCFNGIDYVDDVLYLTPI